DEKYSWPIASRGLTYRLMGRYEAALADFDRAIELDETPDNLEYLVGLYDEINDWENVVATYQRIMELDPNRPYTYYNFGLKLFKRKHIDEAVEQFTHRITLAPETAIGAYIHLGIINIQKNRPDQASINFNTANKLINTSSGRNLYDAATYTQILCLIMLYQETKDVLDQWKDYFSKFHHTKSEIEELIQLLQFLLEAPLPPSGTEKVLSMAQAKLEEITSVERK
ncbi:MAG TPA: tetratricopeptide repeat protein, partial [Anaerolineae bacterium]